MRERPHDGFITRNMLLALSSLLCCVWVISRKCVCIWTKRGCEISNYVWLFFHVLLLWTCRWIARITFTIFTLGFVLKLFSDIILKMLMAIFGQLQQRPIDWPPFVLVIIYLHLDETAYKRITGNGKRKKWSRLKLKGLTF